jgi:cellulose synthase (UDP-forming)
MVTGVGLWIWLCFIVEILVTVEALIFYMTMMRHTDRRAQADKYEAVLRDLPPEDLPTVDVFLPTYNEGIEVLERSILGSLHLDWPKHKLKVWVLDDGNREWLREFCQKVGAGYIRRKEWKHAKAGNLNHAFDITNGEFIAVFDADFVPFRNFLYRTVGFFADHKVAILQTPQHFFNKDYVQSNLHLHDAAPDDQRLFFDVMMPARDGWDAAFWCGSCSLTRRTALAEAGGVPTRSITEDLTTTLVMLRHGYVTRYLNEKLSHGLAPESLPSLLTQRMRWCRGTIQTMFTKDGPLGPGLKMIHRFLFLPWHWLISPFTRFFAFIVPIAFLWTGLPALVLTHYSELINYHFPTFVANLFVALWLAPRHYIPLLSTAISSVEAIQVIPTVLKSLFNPFDKAFGVTPKGKLGRPSYFKGSKLPFSFWTCLILLLLTAAGVVMNLIPEASPGSVGGFFPVAALWACMNIVILSMMLLLSIEHPRNRVDERFIVNQEGTLKIKDQAIPVHIHDMSLSGAQIHLKGDEYLALPDTQEMILSIPKIGDFKSVLVRQRDHIFSVNFQDAQGLKRHGLIQHLYTGAYDNASKLHYPTFMHRLLQRIFGDHSTIYAPPTHEE